MTSQSGEPGPVLYAWLQEEWRAMGTTAEAWCRTHGIPPSTVSRWQTGGIPKIEGLRLVAAGFGLPLLAVLVRAKMITEDEAKGLEASGRVPSVDVAIDADPDLSEWARPMLREFLKALRAVEAGNVEDIRGGTKRDRRKFQTQ